MKDNLFIIDTNILVYAYDSSDIKKHKKASELLKSCWEKKKQYAVSLQILSELFYVITKKGNKLPYQQAEQIINDIMDFTYWKKINHDFDTLKLAMQLQLKVHGYFWDSLIIATMVKNNINSIYTENVFDFSKYEGINVINPFDRI